MKSWYEIRARSSGTEVLIYDEIGAYGVTAKGFLADLSALPDGAPIDLRLNSPGGSVFDAVAIYNALKRHSGEITVWIDGIAASAASYIAMAGDEIVMPENAFLMIHDPSGLVMGTSAEMREMAEILGITAILDRPVGGLSGGDRQRVALGRAIVRDPKAFFMDEPLGALDAEFRERMAEELRALHDRMGATTVYVTHDQLEAMQMGDKIVVMNHGVVEQFGVPQDIYDWPATRFVAQFIGSPPMNFLDFEGMIGAGQDAVRLNDISIKVPTTLQGGTGKLTLGVRPEHVRLDDAAPYRGRILATEYLGTTQIVTLDTPNGTLKARIASADVVSVGQTTGLSFDERTITLFENTHGRALRSQANAGVLAHG
jgi:ABC-type sugar transport system ATPase subunit